MIIGVNGWYDGCQLHYIIYLENFLEKGFDTL